MDVAGRTDTFRTIIFSGLWDGTIIRIEAKPPRCMVDDQHDRIWRAGAAARASAQEPSRSFGGYTLHKAHVKLDCS